MSPRAFSETERAAIRARLLDVAAAHFARFGYRRANIAEVARDAGIGKGTLYLFFASKTELFVEVMLGVEADFRARLLAEMAEPSPSARDRIRRFLRFQMEALERHPLLGMLVDPDEAAALMRDLSPQAMEELRVSDEQFFEGIAERWRREGQLAGLGPGLLGAIPRALFAMALQRDLIGREIFPQVVELFIESLSRSLTPEGDADEAH